MKKYQGKGKEKMTRHDEEREEMLKEVNNTPLTTIIALVQTSRKSFPTHFSWGQPTSSGLTLWKKVRAKKRKSTFSSPAKVRAVREGSPLPKPLSQGLEPRCIPFALTHLLQLQANVISKYREEARLVISLPYMIGVFETLTTRSKNISEFTNKLIEIGLMDKARHDLYLEDDTVKANLSLTWHYGFSAIGQSHAEIGRRIAESVFRFGGALIESYHLINDGELSYDITGAPIGHVVMCYGWKLLKGKYHLKCLDSAGDEGDSNFGFTVLKDLSQIYHVYIIQLNDWIGI